MVYWLKAQCRAAPPHDSLNGAPLVDYDDNIGINETEPAPEKFWTIRRILLLIFAILMIISLLMYTLLAWRLSQPPHIIPVTLPPLDFA